MTDFTAAYGGDDDDDVMGIMMDTGNDYAHDDDDNDDNDDDAKGGLPSLASFKRRLGVVPLSSSGHAKEEEEESDAHVAIVPLKGTPLHGSLEDHTHGEQVANRLIAHTFASLTGDIPSALEEDPRELALDTDGLVRVASETHYDSAMRKLSHSIQVEPPAKIGAATVIVGDGSRTHLLCLFRDVLADRYTLIDLHARHPDTAGRPALGNGVPVSLSCVSLEPLRKYIRTTYFRSTDSPSYTISVYRPKMTAIAFSKQKEELSAGMAGMEITPTTTTTTATTKKTTTKEPLDEVSQTVNKQGKRIPPAVSPMHMESDESDEKRPKTPKAEEQQQTAPVVAASTPKKKTSSRKVATKPKKISVRKTKKTVAAIPTTVAPEKATVAIVADNNSGSSEAEDDDDEEDDE